MDYSNPPFNYPEISVYGEALETHGLSVRGAVFPLGALMFGLVWGCGDVWAIQNTGLSTSWANCTGTTTTGWTIVINQEC